VKWAAVFVVFGALVLAAGIALGEALNDKPDPGGTQTSIRTLEPIQLAPVRVTVTVTTTGP
jgi:hypothetical protein